MWLAPHSQEYPGWNLVLIIRWPHWQSSVWQIKQDVRQQLLLQPMLSQFSFFCIILFFFNPFMDSSHYSGQRNQVTGCVKGLITFFFFKFVLFVFFFFLVLWVSSVSWLSGTRVWSSTPKTHCVLKAVVGVALTLPSNYLYSNSCAKVHFEYGNILDV